MATPQLKEPPEYVELRRMFSQLNRKYGPTSEEGDTSQEFFWKDAQLRLEAGRWGFPPILKALPSGKINRLGHVLLGPIYTSTRHPWPRLEGSPMAPLIQLELREVGRLGGVDLDDGLVQVWQGKTGVSGQCDPPLVRHIPAAAVDLDKLRPVPEFDIDDEYAISYGWCVPAERGEGRSVDRKCFQISNWAKPRFMTQLEEETMEEIFSEFSGKKTKEFKAETKAMLQLLQKFSSKWSPEGNHLFGTYTQAGWAQQSKTTPLFCFESEYAYEGCITRLSYERKSSGKLKFSVEQDDEG